MNDTILIIEDNNDLRENTNELLKLAGYNTHLASNGIEGLQLARKYNPNLILCDIMMPSLDGYGVLKAVENVPELLGIPFIFMSALGGSKDLRKGMDMGADDYLIKPFDGEGLLNMVSGRLKRSRIFNNIAKNSTYDLPDNSRNIQNAQEFDDLTSKRIKKLRKKDMLYMEGDFPNFSYQVISGKIKVFKADDSGKELIVDIYKAGDFFGFVSIFENRNYNDFAMAIENAEVAFIPREDFLECLYSNNALAFKFIEMLSHSILDAEDKLVKLAYNSARKRVAEAIVLLGKKYGNENSVDAEFSLNRENISSLSAISPESVSRNLTDFRDEGLIETSNGNIKILNMKKLVALKN